MQGAPIPVRPVSEEARQLYACLSEGDEFAVSEIPLLPSRSINPGSDGFKVFLPELQVPEDVRHYIHALLHQPMVNPPTKSKFSDQYDEVLKCKKNQMSVKSNVKWNFTKMWTDLRVLPHSWLRGAIELLIFGLIINCPGLLQMNLGLTSGSKRVKALAELMDAKVRDTFESGGALCDSAYRVHCWQELILDRRRKTLFKIFGCKPEGDARKGIVGEVTRVPDEGTLWGEIIMGILRSDVACLPKELYSQITTIYDAKELPQPTKPSSGPAQPQAHLRHWQSIEDPTIPDTNRADAVRNRDRPQGKRPQFDVEGSSTYPNQPRSLTNHGARQESPSIVSLAQTIVLAAPKRPFEDDGASEVMRQLEPPKKKHRDLPEPGDLEVITGTTERSSSGRSGTNRDDGSVSCERIETDGNGTIIQYAANPSSTGQGSMRGSSRNEAQGAKAGTAATSETGLKKNSSRHGTLRSLPELDIEQMPLPETIEELSAEIDKISYKTQDGSYCTLVDQVRITVSVIAYVWEQLERLQKPASVPCLHIGIHPDCQLSKTFGEMRKISREEIASDLLKFIVDAIHPDDSENAIHFVVIPGKRKRSYCLDDRLVMND